jgi:FAD/FMN-containing dehydrogenase
MNLEAAIEQWRGLLGEACVLCHDAADAAYGRDTGGVRRDIAAALRIFEATVMPEVMRIAHRNLVPVYPISTGNNWGYGSSLPVRDGCVLLDMSGMQQILDFDPELGVVTVEPGVTQQMLADFLDAGAHPYLVPVTGAGPHCSLMGNALERGYGITPNADHFGAVTDLQAVLPDGSLYRTALHEAGGAELARLFKWGIGPYSAGLFTQGGFGVVTRMSIVLERRPECVQACLFALRDDALLEPAVLAVRDLLTRLPGILGAVNLMNQHRVLGMSVAYPLGHLDEDGVMGAALLAQLGQQHDVAPWTGFATLYGTRSVVAAAKVEIRKALSGVASRLMFVSPQRARLFSGVAQWVPGATGRRLVRLTDMLRRSLQLVVGRPNDMALALAYWRNPKPQSGPLKNPARDGCGLLWYSPLVPMRPERVRTYVNMVKQLTRVRAMEPLITLTSLNDRLFDSTVPLLFDREDPSAVADAQACYQELLAAGRMQGCFPYRVGVEAMGNLAALQCDSSAFASRLRQGIDPEGLMAPGRYS